MASSSYKHTQIGWVTLIAISGALLLTWGVFTKIHAPSTVGTAVTIGLIGMMALFSSLTVVGDQDRLEIWFGVGVIRKTIRRTEIRSVVAVRNNALVGWGIRWIGSGWMWNVSGLDAVELTMNDGKVFRIGTDDPRGLETFLQDKRDSPHRPG